MDKYRFWYEEKLYYKRDADFNYNSLNGTFIVPEVKLTEINEQDPELDVEGMIWFDKIKKQTEREVEERKERRRKIRKIKKFSPFFWILLFVIFCYICKYFL